MYIMYFIQGRKGYVARSRVNWLEEAHEEHGDILPSESYMIVPGTIDPRDD